MMINVDWRLIYSEACSPRSRYSGEEVIKQTVHLNKSEWYNIQELYCQTQHQDGCRLSRQLRPVDPLPRQLRVHCEYKSVRGRKWPHDTFLFYCFFLSISRHLRPWQAMRDCWIIFLHCRFDDNLQLPFILRKIFWCRCAHRPTPISRAPAAGVWAVGCNLCRDLASQQHFYWGQSTLIVGWNCVNRAHHHYMQSFLRHNRRSEFHYRSTVIMILIRLSRRRCSPWGSGWPRTRPPSSSSLWTWRTSPTPRMGRTRMNF